jgi:hypothetical protein
MTSTAVVFLAAALIAQARQPEKPVLVHADAVCFVHALRAMPDAPDSHVERVIEPGLVLLHTTRSTGEMSVLVRTTGVVAISTRRVSFRVARILGVAADAERLYVLVWTGRAWDKAPARDALVDDGRYELRAFWLADGSPLAAPRDVEGLPKAAPPETLEKGLLRLVEDGVECGGTRAVYKGRDLQK